MFNDAISENNYSTIKRLICYKSVSQFPFHFPGEK